MRTAWMLCLLIAAGLAGCFGDNGDTADPRLSPHAPAATSFLGTPDRTVAIASTSLATPHYVNTGYDGAEPNMGVTQEGNVFVTAFDTTIRSQDGGWTWDVVHEYNPIQGLVERGTSDPMMWVDAQTDRIFVNHMVSLWCFTMHWSDDEGNTWTQRDLACTLPGVDHQKVASGPYGPDSLFDRGTWSNPVGQKLPDEIEDPVCDLIDPVPVLGCIPGNPVPYNPIYPSVLYTCYNTVPIFTGPAPAALGTTDCFMSYDGGLTYPVEMPVLDARVHGCGGIAGHPAFHPDGTVVVPAALGCGGPVIALSTTSGLTWEVRHGPKEYGNGVSIDPDVAFDAEGNMYFTWRDADHMTRLARSPDLGETWDVWNVTAPGLTSTRFHVVSSGDPGRVALAYLGTDYPRGSTWTDADGEDHTWGGAPGDAPPNATWDLYIVTSMDANITDSPLFDVHVVNPPGDPFQKGCLWEGGGGGGDRRCRNLLDFIDSAVHPDGTFYVTTADGCTDRNDCAFQWTDIDELDARDREIVVAMLEGFSLYEEPRDVVPGRSAWNGTHASAVP